MNKYFTVFLSNRFISLISEYGYSILLNIILAQISVHLVMFFWLFKAIAALFSVKINSYMNILNKKIFLIMLEILKAMLILLIIFFKRSYGILPIVFLIETINVLFNSTIYSITPKVISKERLIKFYSLYTSIGSISYFIAPLFVGIFLNVNENILFFIYAFLLCIGASLLFLLPKELTKFKTEENNKKKKKTSFSFFEDFKIVSKDKFIFNMFITSLITGTLGLIFDAYEVIFITKTLGISSQVYSYLLSFLAVIFLLTSFVISFKKEFKNIYFSYGMGLFLYILYLLFFGNSRNLIMIIISYICLAIGQTVMGISETNYRQNHLNSHELAQIYTVSSSIDKFLGGMFVVTVGVIPNFSAYIANFNALLSIAVAMLVSIIFCVLLYKKRL